MQLEDFLALAAEWNRLGGAVQKQLQAVVDDESLDAQNVNALTLIEQFLRRDAAPMLDDSEADATARSEYILGILMNAGSAFGTEWHHQKGKVLLRVSGVLSPSVNDQYKAAFGS